MANKHNKHNKHNPPLAPQPTLKDALRPLGSATPAAAPAAQSRDAKEPAVPTASGHTREQRLLMGIYAHLPGTISDKLVSRAESLPMMMQRHGPMQTLLFLEGKDNDDDKEIAKIFRAALAGAEAGLSRRLPPRGSRELLGYAEQSLTERLHLTRCAVELANLMMRVLKVQRLQNAERGAAGSDQ